MKKLFKKIIIIMILLASSSIVFAEDGSGSSSSSSNSSSSTSNSESSSTSQNTSEGNGGNSDNGGNSGIGGTASNSSSSEDVKTYPDPNASMSDDQLLEISQQGSESQKPLANQILSDRYRRNAIETLVKELYKILQSIDGIKEHMEKSLGSVGTEELKRSERKIQEINRNLALLGTTSKEYDRALETVKGTAEEKSREMKEDANAEKGGDPVRLTSGSYEQNESDFSLGNGMPLEIKRKYVADESINGSFGHSWIFNYDSRIILGTENLEKLKGSINAVKEHINGLEEKIPELEKSLSTFYGVNDIYNAKSELEAKISNCNTALNEVRAAKEKMYELQEEATTLDSAAEKEVTEGINECIKNEKEIEAKISDLREKISSAENEILNLKNLKKELSEERTKLTSLNEKLQKSLKRKALNRFSMLEGSPLYLEETGLNSLTFIDENGSPHILYESEEGKWKNTEEKEILYCIKEEETSYTVGLANGMKLYYDNFGLLVEKKDLNGNFIIIERDAEEKIIKAVNNYSEALAFTYSRGFISKITNVRMEEMFCEYSYNGKLLILARDTDGDTVKMNYDSDEWLISLVKCDESKILFNYELLGENHGIATTSTTNEEGVSEEFFYDIKNKKTIYKDHDNNLTNYYYDSHKRTIRVEKEKESMENHSYGGEIEAVSENHSYSEKNFATNGILNETLANNKIYSFTENQYDDEGNLVQTNENGNITFFEYDSRGNKIKTIFSDGQSEYFSYDDFNNLLSYENADKIRYDFERDKRGNLTEYKVQGKSLLSFEYDSMGRLCKKTEYSQVPVVTEYGYDPFGNVSFEKTGNIKKEYEYDRQNRLTKVSQNGLNIYEYNYGIIENSSSILEGEKKNLSLQVFLEILENFSPSKISYTKKKAYNRLNTIYLTNGRKDLVGIIQEDDVLGKCLITKIEYDKRHLPLRVYKKMTDTNEAEKSMTRKNSTEDFIFGENSSEENSSMNSSFTLLYSYLYNGEGKILSEILHSQDSDKKAYVRSYHYKNSELSGYKKFSLSEEVLQNIISSFNAKSKEENCENISDIKSLILQMETSSNDISEWKVEKSFKQDGSSIIRLLEPEGNQNFFEYDVNGNLVQFTDSLGESKNYQYSASGKLLKAENDFGGFLEYQYDNFLNITQSLQRDQKGAFMNKNSAEYFPDGKIKSSTDSYGIKREYHYDNQGRLIHEEGVGDKTSYSYDNFNRLVKLTNGRLENIDADYELSYEYSEDGRKITVTEGGKYENIIYLDAFGNIIKITDGNGNEKTYEYNLKNELASVFDGYKNETKYEYNALGLVSKITMRGGNETFYEYNSLGKLILAKDGEGILYEASYDKSGRLLSEQSRGDVRKTYEYDALGRITKVFTGGKCSESYDYGSKQKTITFFDGKNKSYQYTYDNFGKLISEKNRLGDSATYTYDQAGEVQSKKSFSNSLTTVSYSTDRLTCTVSYDDGRESTFVYDTMGNIIEAKNENGRTLYEYDRGGRLIYVKDCTMGEEIFYSYDKAGNLTRLQNSNRDLLYTYGKNNEIKKIFDNKQRMSVELEYNKNGNEILRKFGNGTEEKTLYDASQRVIAKVQKNTAGDILWCEGYVYGSDGKRSHCVNSEGLVTFYEYNSQGRLSSVYYPYSKGLAESLKEEAEENGLNTFEDLAENRFLKTSEEKSLSKVLSLIHPSLTGKLKANQLLIKESYEYDENGNRSSKRTAFGKINYTYDEENRLIQSGSQGNNFISYNYDKDGNLLYRKSERRLSKYAYNAQNRLIYSEESDYQKKTFFKTFYAYDAFGRRVIVQDSGEEALRSVYDGFTFEKVKESPLLSSGIFTDIFEDKLNFSNTGKPTGERYRYLSDEDSATDARYRMLTEEYTTSTSRHKGAKSPLYVAGDIVAVNSDNMISEYLARDILGSVTLTTDSYGRKISEKSYDAFGLMLEEASNEASSIGNYSSSGNYSTKDSYNSEVFATERGQNSFVQNSYFSNSAASTFGYLGKERDEATGFYNYGYRDYSPETSRFTTSDPIRDGANWYAYCNGDPVNFVDLWGLEVGDSKRYTDNIVEYLIPKDNEARNGNKRAKTTGIVIHYTDGARKNGDKEIAQTPKQTIDYWIKEQNTSAHFVIGENGEIFLAIPKDEIAYHAGENSKNKFIPGIQDALGGHPNTRTVGIEMENNKVSGAFSSETYNSTVQLTAELCIEYGINPQTSVYMHNDITGKICPKYFVNNPGTFTQFKNDVEKEIADGFFPLKLKKGDECKISLKFSYNDGVTMYDNISCDLEFKYYTVDPTATYTKISSIIIYIMK